MIGPRGERLSLAEFIAGAGLDDQVSITVPNMEERLDADYYQPKFLRLEKRLEGLSTQTIDSLSETVRTGPFGSTLPKTTYEDDGVVVLRPFNIKDATTEEINLVFISEKDRRTLGLNLYEPGDVVFARVGDIRCGIIADYGKPITISPNIIVARLKTGKIDPYFLSIFMNTAPGMLQMERGLKVVAQPTITVETIRSVQVPKVSDEFQNNIGKLFRDALEKQKESSRIYQQAEDLLLAALGLDTLDLSPQLAYTGTFGEMNSANRFDSEYFQPKYQRAMELLGARGQTIGIVARLSKHRFVPKNGKTFRYIEISDVTNDGRVESSDIPGEDAPSRAQFIVHSGDVITSTVRPIRRLSALIEPQQHGYICSSGFAVLQPIAIEPELLLVYLRLPIIAEILDLHTTASMYPAISTADLLSIPIATPDRATSQQIVEKVKQSRIAGLEARQLLESAKRRVEQMILGEAK